MKPKAHIYACDKAAVYGDVEVDLGPDMKIQKVEDIEKWIPLCHEERKEEDFYDKFMC